MEKYPNSGQIDGEIKALKELDQIGGIPNLIHHGMTSENKCFLILPLLNCSLRELVKSQQLSLSQTLAIGLSLIETLEKVHQKNILHLDIKLENIMVSQKLQKNSKEQLLQPGFIQLIDFGLSQTLGNSKFLKNVFIGSLNFASRASHKGESLGYKDDLESLFYVLVYLRNCKLPWSQKPSMGCKNMDIKFIGEMKASIFNTMVLCQKFPLEFSKFMQYIDELKHYQMPDYTYIKELFIKMLQNTSLSPIMDQFLNYSPVQSINQLGSSEKILIRVEQNLPNNNSIETQIQDDIIDVEAKVVHLSDLIGKYTTIQIKSIQTLNIEYDYNSSNLCITK
ncbi:unnamed protein product (macronuclear) [Paramecium tetraurelia]|uniref:Casein kinase I n=1 Tax=Paramecium tetraurelia TaxID=5888 RepID=A0E322_PARTE|nr:uncharacterized protein GSPATT00022862001 [Paramecium tetraurelia]CAK89689.1 unnamed protein product [Paramecium tetraurelia]|eukprot:XP_001457086.1 hypothetical protein (macronuclear) [Paramecium tetraurelia strain d4-2]